MQCKYQPGKHASEVRWTCRRKVLSLFGGVTFYLLHIHTSIKKQTQKKSCLRKLNCAPG